jgi:hypothetical protein
MGDSKTMRLAHFALAIGVGLFSAATALAEPTVPGFAVETWGTGMDRPVRISFGPDGALYVGRNTGPPASAAGKVYRIPPGGGSATEIGNTTIPDPDAILFDAVGALSEGEAGSVIVGGGLPGGSAAQLSAIRPDGTVEVIDGPTGLYLNPQDMVIDSTGRLLFTDADAANVRVMAKIGSGPVTALFALPSPSEFIAVDAGDRIFTCGWDGTVRLYDSSGTPVNGSYATGLAAPTCPIAVGRGGAFATDLLAINQAGELLRFTSPGSGTVIGTGFGVGDLEIGPDLALYVADTAGGRVLRIAPAGSCPVVDADADGEADATDVCPGTAPGASVDEGGCSLEQFCARIDATTKTRCAHLPQGRLEERRAPHEGQERRLHRGERVEGKKRRPVRPGLLAVTFGRSRFTNGRNF